MARATGKLVIAVCSCGATFCDTEEEWKGIEYHSLQAQTNSHRWVYVPDVIVTQELPRRRGR